MRYVELTGVGRTIDLRLPSNRLLILATVAFAVVGTAVGLVGGNSPGTAVLQGSRAGAGAFLAWALGRELDPDRVSTARYAVFAHAGIAWLGSPALVALAGLLLAVRVTLRPTGLAPRPADLAVLAALAVAAAWLGPIGAPLGLAVAAALALDHSLPGPAPRGAQAVVASATVVGVVVAAVVSGSFLGTWAAPSWPEAAAGLAGLAALTQLPVDRVRARADVTGEQLSHHRLTRTRQLAAGSLVLGILWTGAAGIGAAGPLLAAVIGLGATGLSGARPAAATEPSRRRAASGR